MIALDAMCISAADFFIVMRFHTQFHCQLGSLSMQRAIYLLNGNSRNGNNFARKKLKPKKMKKSKMTTMKATSASWHPAKNGNSQFSPGIHADHCHCTFFILFSRIFIWIRSCDALCVCVFVCFFLFFPSFGCVLISRTSSWVDSLNFFDI